MNSCRSPRLSLKQIKRLEHGFICGWNPNNKSLSYNPLEDKHNKDYFKLPSIQTHLKKLKKRMRKQPHWTENTALLEGINRQLSRQKSQSKKDVPGNLKVYIEHYIKHFNKGKGSANTNFLDARSRTGRYRTFEARSLTRNNGMMRLCGPVRTKTYTQQSNYLVNHDAFVQYIQRKKSELNGQNTISSSNKQYTEQ